MPSSFTFCCGLMVAALLLTGASFRAQELYPKPLLHTPADHPADRILLLNIEGMHALDLTLWVNEHPNSALAELSRRGVTYTNAHVPWADPAVGLVAAVTGGSPRSTGIVTVDGYDRSLSPPGSPCGSTVPSVGVAIPLDARAAHAGDGRTMRRLPLDPRRGCAPVAPHALLRVNTLFEIVHARGGRSAWAGDSTAVADLLRGPSGQGLDEACDASGAARAGGSTVPFEARQDASRVDALLKWIDGKDCGGRAAAVPEIFGATFTEVDAAEREGASAYQSYDGSPSAPFNKALAATDAQILRILAALKKDHLYNTTWIVVTSAFGEGAISPRRATSLDAASLAAAADSTEPGVVVHVASEGTAMLWLRDGADTDEVVAALAKRADALGIATMAAGAELALTMNAPSEDPRMPDIVIEPRESIRYTVHGSHVDGGDREDEMHVPLLISGVQFTGRVDKTWVPVTQVAPLLMRALGMDKFDLEALHHEHTPALPGIF